MAVMFAHDHSYGRICCGDRCLLASARRLVGCDVCASEGNNEQKQPSKKGGYIGEDIKNVFKWQGIIVYNYSDIDSASYVSVV